MTDAEGIRLVRRMMAAYPNREIRPETVEVYAQVLADVDYAAAAEAVAQLLVTVKWFPTIAEIRAVVAERAANVSGGGEAWLEFKRAVSKYGYHRAHEVAWSSPVVARTVEAMGGFRELCASDEPEGVLRGHFLRIYDGIRSRHVTVTASATLTAGAKFPAPAIAPGSIAEAVAGLAESKRLAP